MPSSSPLPPLLHTSRRGFIAGASTLAAAAISPRLLARAAAGQVDGAQDSSDQLKPTQDALILLNLRGGADGLSLCIPHAEPRYYTARPNIAIPRPGSGPNAAIDLDGFFGLAPAMAPILPAFLAGHLAIVHAVGTPMRQNSHFRAQRALDSGESGDQLSTASWISRWAQSASAISPARAISIGGPRPIDSLPFLSPALIEPEAQPGASPLSGALGQAISILGANPATCIVSIDCPGWDTHAHQDAPAGALESSMTEASPRLSPSSTKPPSLKRQLSITLVVCTEFGRHHRRERPARHGSRPRLRGPHPRLSRPRRARHRDLARAGRPRPSRDHRHPRCSRGGSHQGTTRFHASGRRRRAPRARREVPGACRR